MNHGLSWFSHWNLILVGNHYNGMVEPFEVPKRVGVMFPCGLH